MRAIQIQNEVYITCLTLVSEGRDMLQMQPFPRLLDYALESKGHFSFCLLVTVHRVVAFIISSLAFMTSLLVLFYRQQKINSPLKLCPNVVSQCYYRICRTDNLKKKDCKTSRTIVNCLWPPILWHKMKDMSLSSVFFSMIATVLSSGTPKLKLFLIPSRYSELF